MDKNEKEQHEEAAFPNDTRVWGEEAAASAKILF